MPMRLFLDNGTPIVTPRVLSREELAGVMNAVQIAAA
jgi:hypothetical protein